MNVLVNILTEGSADLERVFTGAFLLLCIPTLLFFIARARAAQQANKPLLFRPIGAVEDLRGAIGSAAESGRPIHLALGGGAIGRVQTAESLAALLLLDQIVQQAAVYGAKVIVTVADPTLLIAAQDRVRQAAARQKVAPDSVASVRLVAPERSGYAAGVLDVITRGAVSGNVLFGVFEDEFLLMGEGGARKGVPQVAGVADVHVLPAAYATTRRFFMGEEIFAAAAYLGNLPAQLGSLLAQDWLRVLLVIIIIAGAVIHALG